MTAAADKFFDAVREYAIDACRAEVVGLRAPFVLNYDWKPNDAARAKLLEAVDEYAGLQLALKTRALDDVEAQLAVYDKLVVGFQLLEAKARVCDAVAAWEPEENRNSTSWARVSEALRAVREPGQQRPNACIQSPSSPIDWLLQETEDVALDRVPTLTRPVWSLAKQLAAEVHRLRELEKTL